MNQKRYEKIKIDLTKITLTTIKYYGLLKEKS